MSELAGVPPPAPTRRPLRHHAGGLSVPERAHGWGGAPGNRAMRTGSRRGTGVAHWRPRSGFVALAADRDMKNHR